MIYTAVSLQGSVEALRGFNRVVHFTQYTVGHAHLGVYGFASLILFGCLYFIIPRLVDWEWPSDKLIRWHFWLALAGVLIYVGSLSIGGWLQGEAMLDASAAVPGQRERDEAVPDRAVGRRHADARGERDLRLALLAGGAAPRDRSGWSPPGRPGRALA